MHTLQRFKNIYLKFLTHEVITYVFLNLAGLNFSLVNAFPGILITQLQKGHHRIHKPDDSESSNIASLGVLTACVAAFVGGFINDQLGRKCALTLSYILSLTGWIMYYVSSSLTEIYIARIISGCTVGFSASLYQHVAEISQPSNRGVMLVGSSAVASFGYILVFSLSTVNYRHLCIMYGVYCVTACILHRLFVLESPTWYVQKNRLVEARRVLEKLTGGNEKLAEEQLNDMMSLRGKKPPPDYCCNGKPSAAKRNTENNNNKIGDRELNNNDVVIEKERNVVMAVKMSDHDEMDDNNNNNNGCCWLICEQLKLWKLKRVYKPFLILWFYMLFLPLNGVQFIISYPISFYQLFGTAALRPEFAAVVFSLATFVANLLNPLIIHKFRRRIIAIYSTVFMLLTVTSLTVWQYYLSPEINDSGGDIINDHQQLKTLTSWVTLILVSVYVITASCGNTYMPWTMTSEILSQNTRAYQIALLSIWSYLLSFVTTKIFFLVLNSCSLPYMLLFFAVDCLLCGIYIYLFLPETYNKSLVQIEREFDD